MMINGRRVVLWVLLSGVFVITRAQQSALAETSQAEIAAWVDSIMSQMTVEEKIGQMLMIPAYSRDGEDKIREIQNYIRSFHIGGITMMQGSPDEQIYHVNAYQKVSKIPLLISQDAEWGAAMRLKGVPAFPRAMTLGAIQNDSLLYTTGAMMGEQLSSLGVKLNFAPVADINNNPLNPVIHTRSFGENKFNVARSAQLVAKGMEDHGVMACAKHFPGHGDTGSDSHFSLPLIPHDKERLDSMELYPFSHLINNGIGACMVAHLYIPSLDNTENRASTLSPKIIQGLLRERLGHKGLIITDAMNMHGVTKYYPGSTASIQAFKAGNDILLFPQDIPNTVRGFQKAIVEGDIRVSDINQRVRRILSAKYKLGLNKFRPVSTLNLDEKLNGADVHQLIKKLYESAITIASDPKDLLPLKYLAKREIAYIQVGGRSGNDFDKTLQKYASVTPFYLRKHFSSGELRHILSQVEGYNTVVIGVYDMSSRASQNYGVSQETIALVNALALRQSTVVSLFGTPYSLKNFEDNAAIIMAYENVPEAERAAAEAIFGGIAVSGRLPVGASSAFPEGRGKQVLSPVRFGFSYPEEKEMDGPTLMKIDSIAQHHIQNHVIPGCAILVARGNQIVYSKGFGKTHSAFQGESIDPFYHTYDLASITKVLVTTLCAMKLVENKKLDLDTPIAQYLPSLKGTNKARLTVRKLMMHTAGLPAWIPFFQQTYADSRRRTLDPQIFQTKMSNRHKLQIAPALFVNSSYPDSMWQQIIDVPVRRTSRMRYSDLGMIILGRIIESVSGMKLNDYVRLHFYDPLGMDHAYFNPAHEGKEKACPPTQLDKDWRKVEVRGFVHDQTAALMGGVAGHAGLFSNVFDLYKVLLMIKQGGFYGGERFLSNETIQYFTRQQTQRNRKGLGWDKPEIRYPEHSPVSAYSSRSTFGHTGFTGTAAWVDPQYDLVYIFLSNRTYPDVRNQAFHRSEMRKVIMDKIYESIAMYDYKLKQK